MQNIIEGNIQIALFMGAKKDTAFDEYDFQDAPGFKKPNRIMCTHVFTAKELLYHSSFDWLMPVWLKCKDIGLWMMCNNYNALWLEKSKEIETAIVHEIDCKKAALRISWLITWYNNQTSING